MASAPVVTAILASSTSRMPFRISLPGHRLLTHSTYFQLKVGSNWLAVHAASELMFVVSFTRPARLPKVLLLAFRIGQAQAAWARTSTTFFSALSGGPLT